MDKQEMREVKIDIDNGQSFFADEVGVIHNPIKFVFDFRSITPRVDVRTKNFHQLVLKHNVVVMDVFTAKSFLEILVTNVKNYEERFGRIKKPKVLEKMEKEAPQADVKRPAKDMPNYFG